MATNNKNFKVKNGLDVGGNADVTGDATVAGKLSVTASSGDEGGEIFLAKPATNTNIAGTGVTLDIYQNKLRFFEQGGDARGYYIDITGGGSAASTNLVGGGSASNSFTTINVPNGTDPSADSSTDTLNLADGANITITGDSSTDTVTVAVDADLTAINGITFDTTPTTPSTAVGTLSWDADNETANLKIDEHVDLQIGQEHVVRVKNSSGSVAIPKGTAVMFAGATGDTVTATPAISTSSYEPTLIIGITAEEIPADGFGFVTQFGFINNLNTGGMTLGSLLYVDPATPGLLTTTLPSAPNWTFPIAAVTRVNSSSGRILVRTIPGGHLHDVVDVAISSPADNEVLAYNSGNGTWINQTASEAGLSVVGHTHSLTDVTDVTASAAEVNILDGATLSTTELNYVDGVTSAIQTQLNAKADTSSLGTASTKNVAATGNASSTEVVIGNDTRLSDTRNTTNSLVIQTGSASTEGTDLFTFNGSAAKSINIATGTGLGISTVTPGTLSIGLTSNSVTIGSTALSLGETSTSFTGLTSLSSASATDLSIATDTTGVLTLDSGTTGAVNVGTSANAKTITIGNSTGATKIDLTAGTGYVDVVQPQPTAGATPAKAVRNIFTGTGSPTGSDGADGDIWIKYTA